MPKDKIILKGMIFHAYHGVLAAEKELGQRFIVDLEMSLNLKPAGDNDDLRLTINYAEIYELVKKIMLEAKYDLIETVGEKIAQAALIKDERIEEIKVLLKKPEVPIAGILDYAAIEIVRGRKK